MLVGAVHKRRLQSRGGALSIADKGRPEGIGLVVDAQLFAVKFSRLFDITMVCPYGQRGERGVNFLRFVRTTAS